MNIALLLTEISDILWSLPFLIFFFAVCIFMTVYLNFVQFRYFTASIRMIFVPHKSSAILDKSEILSPFQAFINTLGGNIGNGSLAGIPVAISIGGPGSIFWLLIMSTFSVALRFAEVYLAVNFSQNATHDKSGPMYYLSLLPFGNVLSFLFAIFLFGYMMTGGNLIQCNAVGLVMQRVWAIPQYITASFILVFILYIVFGGAQRIVKILDYLVPIKVYGFLLSAFIVLFYHIASIPHALYLIVSCAFNPQAVLGASCAFMVQKSITLGLQQGVNASESGLGTAASTFGATKGHQSVANGIMSMLSVYINTHIVCFLVALSVLASGVWNNGETSTALLVSAYETVFGFAAGWIVTTLVIMFAMSVVVAYAYNAKICWQFLTSGRYTYLFVIFYAVSAWYGTVMNAPIVWTINSLVTGCLFLINVTGLLYFAQNIKRGLKKYINQ